MTTAVDTAFDEPLLMPPTESSTAIDSRNPLSDSCLFAQVGRKEEVVHQGLQNQEFVSTEDEYLLTQAGRSHFWRYEPAFGTSRFVPLPQSDSANIAFPIDWDDPMPGHPSHDPFVMGIGRRGAVYGFTSHGTVLYDPTDRPTAVQLPSPEFVASRVLIDALVPGSLVQPVLTTRGRIHDVVDYGTDDKLLTMLQAFASGYSPGHEPKTNLNTSFLKRVGIRSILERAFREAAEEVFEYGMESRLSRTLGFLVQRYSNDAVAELDRALLQEDAVLEVREEALLQLGSIEHKPTQRSRLYLLIKHLKSNLVSVRDSAALGIAAMDDPLAIPPLRHAVQVEPSGRLRKDLQLVLDQLMATKGCQIT